METLIHSVERRSSIRHPARYLRSYSPIPGTILNLSEWGMSLETVEELEAGAVYQFKIRKATMLFAFKGTVMWSRHRSTLASTVASSVQLYCCGVAFSEPVSEEALEFLTELG